MRWLILVGLVGFFLMGYDKLKAGLKKGRIPEKRLWLTAFVGGFFGIIAGGIVFHHKVAKGSFWPPVIVATALWMGLLLLIVF